MWDEDRRVATPSGPRMDHACLDLEARRDDFLDQGNDRRIKQSANVTLTRFRTSIIHDLANRTQWGNESGWNHSMNIAKYVELLIVSWTVIQWDKLFPHVLRCVRGRK